jgi:hypothetical protein
MTDSIPVPFDLTNRDYSSIRDQLVTYVQTRLPEWNPTNSADFGVILLEAFSLIGDNLSYYLDRIANETSIVSAAQPESVFALARQLGYEPGLPRPSNVTITFTNSGSSAATIPEGTQIFGVATVNGKKQDVVFETESANTLAASAVVEIICSQGITYSGVDGTGEVLGVSDGTSSQRVSIPKRPVISGSVRVITNDGSADTEWMEVDNLYNYGPGDFVFTVHSTPSASAYIQFGNGSYGALPTQNTTIKAIYRIGGGVVGNVGANTIASFVATAPSNVTFTQTTAAYGGADAENLSSVRQNAPGAFYTQRRAITANDFQSIAQSLPVVSKANADVTLWSNPVVYAAPPNDGSYTPGQIILGALTGQSYGYLQTVQATLQRAAMAGTTVSVAPPSYISIAVKVTCYLDPRTSQKKADAAVYNAITQLYAFDNQDFAATLSMHDILFAISQIKSSLLLSYSKSWAYINQGRDSGGGGGIRNRTAGPQSVIKGVSGTGHVQYADVTGLYRKDLFSSGIHAPTTGKSYEIFYLNALRNARTVDKTTTPLLPTVTYGDLVITLSGGVYDL